MEEHLRTSQFCGVPGNTVLEAAATVKEAIAQVEITHPTTRALIRLPGRIRQDFALVFIPDSQELWPERLVH